MATFTLTWTGVTAVGMARLIRMAERAKLGDPVVSIDGRPVTFTVAIADNGANRIQVIKAIRALTGMGLKEAKDVTEIGDRIVETGCSALRAEEIRKALTEAGATVKVS